MTVAKPGYSFKVIPSRLFLQGYSFKVIPSRFFHFMRLVMFYYL